MNRFPSEPVTSYRALINTLQVSQRFCKDYNRHIYSAFHHQVTDWAGDGFLPFLFFLPPSRPRAARENSLSLLELCQVQIIIYSLTLDIALTTEGGGGVRLREILFIAPDCSETVQKPPSGALIRGDGANVKLKLKDGRHSWFPVRKTWCKLDRSLCLYCSFYLFITFNEFISLFPHRTSNKGQSYLILS